MVTISDAFSLLDNLVLDYIENRWKIAREQLPINVKQDHRHTAQDITLQEIYLFYYVGNSNFRDKSLQTIMNCTKNFNMEIKIDLPVPKLPLEIVEQILELGSSMKQLHRFRFVSRNVNNRLCKHLQHYRKLSLTTQWRSEQFLRRFGSRMQHLSHSFGLLDFYNNDGAIAPVLEVVGSRQYVGMDELDATYLTQEVLSKMHNVRSLCLYGFPNVLENVFDGDVKLPALRYLVLRQKFSDQDVFDMEYVKAWLRLAPSLRAIRSSIAGTISIAQALDLFRSHPSLSKLTTTSLDGLCISWKNREMAVDLTLMGHAGELVAYGNLVSRLTLPYEYPHRLPPLPRLKHLIFYRRRGPDPLLLLQPNPTPSLEHVTLDSPISVSFPASYRDSVFKTVVSLHLKGGPWTWSESHPPHFHHIFPSVATLEISGHLPAEFIKYFASHFEGVSTLKFTDFDNGCAKDLPLFQVKDLGQKELKWPFFKLQSLKTLEFRSVKVRNIVLTLMWLTLNKYIQPIQKLHVVQLCYGENDDRGERLFFYSMHHLNYHKELKFSVG